MSESKITNVYRFANGMVVVFDQYGKQMPDYQGKHEDVVNKIKETGFTDIRWGEMKR